MGIAAKWGILYCPKAGITNKRKRWEKIQKVLDENQVAYDFVQSETSDSVERLMKMMISNGYKTIIIVGGDSALNEAVNCLMMEEKEVVYLLVNVVVRQLVENVQEVQISNVVLVIQQIQHIMDHAMEEVVLA